MRSTMSLFVAGFGRASSEKCRAAMLIGDIDILGLWFMFNMLGGEVEGQTGVLKQERKDIE